MRFAIDTDAMLAKCERLQWKVGEIEWDAPGSEAVSPDERDALRGFMIDLYWIESIAAIAFDAMKDNTEDAKLRGIFSTFAADEQRHADAELMLMRRWRIARKNEIPAPNPNARNLLCALERSAGRVHPAIFSAIIPFTELVLDGALVKHLDVTIEDPVCTEVFKKINADEARHLAVDFYMLERFGAESKGTHRRHLARAFHPLILYALLLGYLPLLSRVKPKLPPLGLTEEQIMACIKRYIALGDESADVARHPVYNLFRRLSQRYTMNDDRIGEFLMRVSDVCDVLDLGIASRKAAA
jgi:hypothetical protein